MKKPVNRHVRLAVALAAALGFLPLLSSPVAATSVTPLGQGQLADEQAYAATVSVDPNTVKSVAQMPDRWFQALQLDSAGRATLGITLGHGQFTAFGETEPSTYVDLWAVLDPAKLPLPERNYDTSSIMGNRADFYLIQLAGDGGWDRWLTAGGVNLGPYVRNVPGMNETLTPGLLDTLNFAAPNPYALQFTQTATKPLISVPGGFHNNWWRATTNGTWRMDDVVQTVNVAQFKDWSLSTDPATPLGQLIAGGTTAGTCAIPSLAGGQLQLGTNPLSPLLTTATGQFGLGCTTGLTSAAGATVTTELIPSS